MDPLYEDVGATTGRVDDYGIKLVSSAEPKLREVIVPKVSLMGKSKRKIMTNGSESTVKESIK